MKYAGGGNRPLSAEEGGEQGMSEKSKQGRQTYMREYMRRYRQTPQGAANVKEATTRFFERQREKQLQQEAEQQREDRLRE